MQRQSGIYFGRSDVSGRGVFTAQEIVSNALIEICPVIVLPAQEMPLIHQTHLHDYYFLWGEDQQQCAIVLGFGSLYNHSIHPNAEFAVDYQKKTIDIYSLRTIAAGEEITISYNGYREDDRLLWFDNRE